MAIQEKLLLLLSVIMCLSQAVVRPPLIENPTYVPSGDNVTIAWNYTDADSDLVTRRWFYQLKNSSSSPEVALFLIITNGDPDRSAPNPFNNINVYKPATLVLTNVTLVNNGTYGIEITLKDGSRSKSKVVVIVTEQPTANVGCPGSTIVKEGSNFSCLCNSVGGNPPPFASWSKNGALIGGYLEKNLVLTNVSEDNSGTYICSVKSHTLEDERNITITVNTKPRANVNCSRHNEPNKGESFSCNCSSIGGNPTPNASWTEEGKSVPINGSTPLSNVLSFPSVTKSNKGNYTCKVQSLTLFDEIDIDLYVRYKPETPEVKVNVTSIFLGDAIEITCVSDGYPEPRYNLTFNNGENEITLLSNEAQVKPIINSVTNSHNGSYVCTAFNILGSSTGILTVNVLPEEQPTANVSCQGSTIVKEGLNFSCLCNSTGGNPPPFASWSKNGTLIDGSGYLKKNLVLTNVSEEDAGNYTCTVKSRTLEDERNITVIVNKQPTANVGCPGSTIVEEGLNFSCLCDSVGGNPPLFASWSKNGALIDGPDYLKKNLVLTNVSEEDAGIYTCTVKSHTLEDERDITVIVHVNTPAKSDGLSKGAIAGIAVGVLFLIIILILLVCYCRPSVCCCVLPCFNTEKSGERGNIVIDNNSATYNYTPGGMAENPYESPDGKTNDGASNSSSSRPSTGAPTSAQGASDLPPVYSVVDKSRMPKKTKEPKKEEDPNQLTYASLDPVALQPDSSRMHPREKPESNYAQIDLGKL